MFRVVLTISLIATLISGCATNKALNCAGWRAIHPSRSDVLTRGTKEQIVAHNEFGVAQGCWSEP